MAIQEIDTTKSLYDANPVMIRSDPLRFLLYVSLLSLSIIFIIFIKVLTFIAFPVLLMTVWATLCWVIDIHARRLIITDKFVFSRYGILNRNVTQIFIADITKFNCNQTFWQRIFKVGDVEISSSASSETEISISSLPRPQEIIAAINQYR